MLCFGWQVGGERAARDRCDVVLHQRYGCHAPGASHPVANMILSQKRGSLVLKGDKLCTPLKHAHH